MKTIGLLGGMSWESTAEYYRLINQGVFAKLKGLNSAPLLMQSFNFQQLVDWQDEDEWDKVYQTLLQGSQQLERCGADAVMICTNTMHKFADEIQAEIGVPLLHIADAAGQSIVSNKHKKVALFGTKFTMQGDFYKQRLADKFSINAVAPKLADQEIIHTVIYEELSQGQIKASSREAYLSIMQSMQSEGCEAVVLACTEIPLLISAKETTIPLYDTTALHAAIAVSFILGES